jgi:DNA-binding GntR family transcriptional regulator
MLLDKMKKIKAPSSLSDIAYKTIRGQLLEMDLDQMPDEGRIDERGLAERLGISRTPLREAINRLVSEGFLKVVPRKGIYVVKKSKKEIIEILLVRAALESMAARLATKYVTDEDIRDMKEIFSPFNPSNMQRQFLRYSDANIEFHELVLRISQCEKLIELARSIFDHIRWIRFRAAAFGERLAKTHQEHLEIIEAIENRDRLLAERRMRRHIEELANYIEENVDFLS